MNGVRVPGSGNAITIAKRDEEMPEPSPVTTRPMTDEERARYGPPSRPTMADIRERVANGLHAEDVAKEFGVPVKRVQRLMQMHAQRTYAEGERARQKREVQPVVEVSVQPQGAVLRPELTKEALQAAIAEGKTILQLAQMFGVSHGTISARKNKWGLSQRCRGLTEIEPEKGESKVEGEEGRMNLTVVRLSEKGDTTRICRVLSGASALVETLGGEFEVTVSLRRVAS